LCFIMCSISRYSADRVINEDKLEQLSSSIYRRLSEFQCKVQDSAFFINGTGLQCCYSSSIAVRAVANTVNTFDVQVLLT